MAKATIQSNLFVSKSARHQSCSDIIQHHYQRLCLPITTRENLAMMTVMSINRIYHKYTGTAASTKGTMERHMEELNAECQL